VIGNSGSQRKPKRKIVSDSNPPRFPHNQSPQKCQVNDTKKKKKKERKNERKTVEKNKASELPKTRVNAGDLS